ncbi:hypothetical protein BGY98DRAFT_1002353 [Russula aff. rugulosa BPL654]|nr:hypothetical protein BGY98DRAFT_1002353 [Russula aff. rugulosa BPL654]
MSTSKRPREGGAKPKKRYRSDGTPIWGKRAIDGPGVWVSCVKGKEKQTVGELYDLFESLASELWPESTAAAVEADDDESHAGSDVGEVEEDLEKQIAKELASIKRPRKEQRFANCQTNTPCVIFISCKPPVDPVQLVLKHVENVERTGVTNTRYTHRLTPITNTCVANVQEIKSLAQRVLKLFLAQNPDSDYRYKIELKVRNHNSLSRQLLIDTVVSCVPSGWTVDLEDAEVFFLVEVFKSVCGIGIVKGYYAHQKFNVMEIAKMKNEETELGREGRLTNI